MFIKKNVLLYYGCHKKLCDVKSKSKKIKSEPTLIGCTKLIKQHCLVVGF